MGNAFVATTITKTESADGVIEITLADRSGNVQMFRATPDVAQSMAQVCSDFARSRASTSAPPTKLPSRFAVGAGRYEPVVLVRFEDDVPYGLCVQDAAELGRALLEQSRTVATKRPALVQ